MSFLRIHHPMGYCSWCFVAPLTAIIMKATVTSMSYYEPIRRYSSYTALFEKTSTSFMNRYMFVLHVSCQPYNHDVECTLPSPRRSWKFECGIDHFQVDIPNNMTLSHRQESHSTTAFLSRTRYLAARLVLLMHVTPLLTTKPVHLQSSPRRRHCKYRSYALRQNIIALKRVRCFFSFD